MKFAMMFPGQGSQAVGMLSALAGTRPEVLETFQAAGQALGEDLWGIVQRGPEERLNSTEITQPALLAAGVAVYRVWDVAGGRPPAVMAGHSLGEYTALVCAEALDFEDAVRLVSFRGRVMQDAVPAGVGAMAAILGLDDGQVEAVCERAAEDQVVEPVNYNSAGQVVVAGHAEAVERAMELARSEGAKRAVRLPVSVPSHCSLMEDASRRLAQRLEEVELRRPVLPVIHNVDARPRGTPAEIRAALVEQLHRPVRWSDCVRAMQEQGAAALVEAGPGKVLAGLARRIDRDLKAWPVHDPESLEAALSALA